MTTGSKSGDALQRRLEIKNRFGLHARAAKELITVAERFVARITINEQSVARTNMLGLLMLAAAPGTMIDVVVEGADAEAAMAAIEALFEARFNEDE